MSTTTALQPQPEAMRRTTTQSSAASSATSTPHDSPLDTPRRSPSNGSISSLSDSEPAHKDTKQKLLDTHGNEFQIPDYTIKQIHDAIPKHCFERSAATGLYYVARDVALLASTFSVVKRFIPSPREI